MPADEFDDSDETLYPESPKGAPYATAPKPLPSDLKSVLEKINKQDVGAKRPDRYR